MDLVTVGDLHLTDSTGSGGLAKYIEDPDLFVIGELGKAADYARRKDVETIALMGDVCDGPRMSYEAMMSLVDFFDAYTDRKFLVFLGNHDMYGEDASAGHSLQLLARIYRGRHVKFFTKPKTIEIDGTPLRILPYPHTSFDVTALNLFHNEVYGSQGDSGRINKDEQLSKSKAVALGGHLHTAHRVRNTTFMGTLYQSNFGEKLPKYFAHVTFDSPDEHDVRLIKNDPKYKLHTVILQTRDDLANIPTRRTDLVKLVIQDGCDVSAEDYAHRKNIVVLKNFKTKADLAAVLTEDIKEGTQLVIRTDDFFREWIASLDVEEQMRKRVRSIRRRIINSVQDPRQRYKRAA